MLLNSCKLVRLYYLTGILQQKDLYRDLSTLITFSLESEGVKLLYFLVLFNLILFIRPLYDKF